ncbi:MAG: hypothetical protein MJE66_25745, partial [Proteobacteria bacterium]|nr:hypothetical protein [Pseudomonadota bacterium]
MARFLMCVSLWVVSSVWAGSAHAQLGTDIDASLFVGQNVPTTLTAGQNATVSVTFQNVGNTIWREARGYKLGSQSPQDNERWGLARVLLAPSESVAPGQQKTFTFQITAPDTPGNHPFRWRMVYEGVRWFGQFSEEVTIQVLPASVDNAAFVSQSVPSSLTAGGTHTVSVTMRNTGNTTWTHAGRYRLGSQNPQDNERWGLGRVVLSPSDSIAPGQQKTFTFQITAPNTPGPAAFRWRMVHEGVNWFGAFTPNTAIQVQPQPVNNAAFVSQSVPSSLMAGERRTVSVTMRNTGTTTWTRAEEYKLGSEEPI